MPYIIKNLQDILTHRCLIVVLNQSVNSYSTSDEIEDRTLHAWKLNYKRAKEVEFIIGIVNGVAVSCFYVTGSGVNYSDGRVFFSNREANGTHNNYTNLVSGNNLITLGIKTNRKEVQYINC